MEKKALLVIDMQNDYLWEKRKKMFSYDTEQLVKNINATVHSYKNNGWDVYYIAQVFPNIITNRLIIGFSIKNTEGAELYSGLDVVSELYFEKNLPDTFTAKKFREHFNKQGYTEVAVCGVDECGCAGATALGAVKNGYKVSILKDCTGCRYSDKKLTAQRKKLSESGVKYI